MVLALFFPYSGISRALESIVRYSRFRRTNELQRAARAGDLCIVARSSSDVIGLVGLLVGPVGKSRKSQPVMSIDWLATG